MCINVKNLLIYKFGYKDFDVVPHLNSILLCSILVIRLCFLHHQVSRHPPSTFFLASPLFRRLGGCNSIHCFGNHLSFNQFTCPYQFNCFLSVFIPDSILSGYSKESSYDVHFNTLYFFHIFTSYSPSVSAIQYHIAPAYYQNFVI